MAYANFKPTIWSAHIQHELPKFTVFEQGCNYQFSGDVGRGKTVNILGVTAPTIGNYTGADIGAPETQPGTTQTLLIDQAKFFNFMVDDVDEAQSVEGLMAALMEESTRAMAEERDKFIAQTIAANGDATAVTQAITSKATAKTAVDKALTALWNEGVPQGGKITIYLNPEAYMYLADYIVEAKTDNDKLVASGVLGKYMGANVKMSNNFADNTLFVMTDKAVAFKGCIESVEAYRPEGLFSDAVKGLNTFGCKVVRPKELVLIKQA
jgi:hypothetical protein